MLSGMISVKEKKKIKGNRSSLYSFRFWRLAWTVKPAKGNCWEPLPPIRFTLLVTSSILFSFCLSVRMLAWEYSKAPLFILCIEKTMHNINPLPPPPKLTKASTMSLLKIMEHCNVLFSLPVLVCPVPYFLALKPLGSVLEGLLHNQTPLKCSSLAAGGVGFLHSCAVLSPHSCSVRKLHVSSPVQKISSSILGWSPI